MAAPYTPLQSAFAQRPSSLPDDQVALSQDNAPSVQIAPGIRKRSAQAPMPEQVARAPAAGSGVNEDLLNAADEFQQQGGQDQGLEGGGSALPNSINDLSSAQTATQKTTPMEGTLPWLNFKVRITENGAQEYFNGKDKKWLPLPEIVRSFYRTFYNTVAGLPTTAAAIAAPAIAGAAIPAIAGAGLLGAGARTLSAGLGAAGTELVGAPERAADAIFRATSGENNLNVLKAVVGDYQPSPMTSGLMAVGAQGIGEIVRGVMTPTAKSLSNINARQIARQSLDQAQVLENAAKGKFGVDLYPSQLAEGRPGMGGLQSNEQALRGTAEGSAILLDKNLKQATQIGQAFDKVQAELGPNAPVMQDIKEVSGIGGYGKQTFLDRMRADKVQSLREAATDVQQVAQAQGIKADPYYIRKNFEQAITEKLGFIRGIKTAEGDLNPTVLFKWLEQHRAGSSELSQFRQAYATLRQAAAPETGALGQSIGDLRSSVTQRYEEMYPGLKIPSGDATVSTRTPPNMPFKGFSRKSPNPSGNRKFDFQTLSQMTDYMQALAANVSDSQYGGAVKALASDLSDMESDIVTRAYTAAGQPEKAAPIITQRQNFSKFQDLISGREGASVNQLILENPTNAARTLYENYNPDNLAKLWGFLEQPTRQQLASEVVKNAAKDAMLDQPESFLSGAISAKSLRENLFPGRDGLKKAEVIFGDKVKDVSTLVDIAEAVQKSAKSSLPKQLTAGKMAIKTLKDLKDAGYDAVGTWIGMRPLFSEFKDAQSLIDAGVSQLSQDNTKALQGLIKQKSVPLSAVKKGIAAGQATPEAYRGLKLLGEEYQAEKKQ